jgi:hypothetical protein
MAKVKRCADARILVEIVWALPGKAARHFRRSSAQTVCRIRGDLSLVAEIEACHDSLQTEGGKAAQTFLVKDSSCGETERTCKRFKGELPMELQIASTEQKSAYCDWWLQEKQQQLEERRMSVQKQLDQQEGERRQQPVVFVQNGYSVLAQLGVVDARDKITCGDLVRRILQEKASTETTGSVALITARAPPPDDLSIPTPKCAPVHRGKEISMHSVAARLNARIPQGKEGQVGTAIKPLYAARYNTDAASLYTQNKCAHSRQNLCREHILAEGCRSAGASSRSSCETEMIQYSEALAFLVGNNTHHAE